jgi:hypothetical protein
LRASGPLASAGYALVTHLAPGSESLGLTLCWDGHREHRPKPADGSSVESRLLPAGARCSVEVFGGNPFFMIDAPISLFRCSQMSPDTITIRPPDLLSQARFGEM